MNEIIELILHTDDALLSLVSENVNKAYLVLFLIIMLETGIILFPFLPGDGLLFSAGVIAATTNLNILALWPLLLLAAITGNLLNYFIGNMLGTGLRQSRNRFIQKSLKPLERTEMYYLRHGNKALVIGRFFPVIRTFIPFFAGVVKMPFKLFFNYTVLGALLWITLFLFLGYFLGGIAWVKNNYGLIFLCLIIITFLPFLITLIRRLFVGKKS
ncbi:MAG: VTT domain-containing protein [Aequorivita sp.]|nr:VTT domain-containing protein [Aequorivita sp.]